MTKENRLERDERINKEEEKNGTHLDNIHTYIQQTPFEMHANDNDNVYDHNDKQIRIK